MKARITLPDPNEETEASEESEETPDETEPEAEVDD
jgi:hypothetical protein